MTEKLLHWRKVLRVDYRPEFIEVWTSCDDAGPLCLYIKGSLTAKNGMARREFFRGTTRIMKPTAAMIEGFYHTVLTKAQWERMNKAKEDIENREEV